MICCKSSTCPAQVRMKQVLQSLQTSELLVAEVPVPQVPDNGVLVRSIASLVSAGTERMVLEFAKKNLLQKARSRPELVRQVLQRARREGIVSTFEAVSRRLGEPMPLGYSLVGEVVDVGAEHPRRRGRGSGGLRRGRCCEPCGVRSCTPASLRYAAAGLRGRCARRACGVRDVRRDRAARVPTGRAPDRRARRGAWPGLARPTRRADSQRGWLSGVWRRPRSRPWCRSRLEHGAGASVRSEAEDRGDAFSRGAGFDIVLIAADTSSNDPILLAAQLARDRAHVIALGSCDLSLPRKAFFSKELHFQVSRSYGPGRYDPDYEIHGRDYPIGYVRWTEQRNLAAFVELLATRKVSVGRLITHRFDVSAAPHAYEVIAGQSKEPSLGVLLTYPQDAPLTRRVDHTRVTTRPARGQTLGISVIGSGLFASTTLIPALKQLPEVRLRGLVSAQGLSAQTLGRSSASRSVPRASRKR